MAIDKQKTKELLKTINDLFDSIPVKNESVKSKVKELVLGPALEDIRKLVEESRPPVLLLMGRSGHGKSSLINALAGKDVAEVNDIRPQEPKSEPYFITFKESHATWKVIDSRGVFESSKPNGSIEEDAVEVLKNSILTQKPDVILHAISTPETRNLQKDLELLERIRKDFEKKNSYSIPTMIVLTKADTFENPRQWPPEEMPKKAAQLDEVLQYMTNEVLKVEKVPLNLNYPYYGYKIDSKDYVGIIPVASIKDDLWNIDTLSDFIGKNLSEEAQLDFFQAQKRKEPLKRLSSNIIDRFSKIAGGVGSTPIPVADIVLLVPIQLLMISIIGALSGRQATKETAFEYLAASGINIGAGIGLREIARQASKLIPVGGFAVSGAIAGASTWAIGKSAEAYFFNNELKSPEFFKRKNEDNGKSK